MKTIETERLLLEPLEEDRLEEFVALTADAQSMRYWRPLGTFSREQAEERFERALARTRERGFGRRWIVLKDTGAGIGFTETKLLGEGYEEVEPFERIGLQAVIALHHPENQASGRIMEKLGMEHERDLVDHTGWPYRLYRLTREHWEHLRVSGATILHPAASVSPKLVRVGGDSAPNV